MESDLYNLDDLTAMSTLAAETNNNTNIFGCKSFRYKPNWKKWQGNTYHRKISDVEHRKT